MLILDANTKSLKIVLAGAVTAAQLPVTAHYTDITSTAYTPGSNDTITNDTTIVEFVAAPAASTQRHVESISVYNVDTAAATVTIQYVSAGGTRQLVKVVLQSLYALYYEDGHGWQVIDANGSIVSGSNVSDTAYAATWDGVTTIAPSKNAVYDQMQLKVTGSSATAESSFIVSGASPFAWIEKTLAQVKTILGLVLTQTAEAVGFTLAGGTTPKTLTVPANVTLPTITSGGIPYGSAADVWADLAKGAANLKMFMNAGATAPEWAAGFYVHSTTRDMTAATGDVAYTGAGFKPFLIIAFSTVESTTAMSIGFATATVQGNIADYSLASTGANSWAPGGELCALFTTGSGVRQLGSLKTMDADGFTLTWTKTGSPTGIANLIFLLFR